jgi:hypothetical protein
MNASELAQKPPMAVPGFKTITPKAETEYDKKIQEEQEKQLMDCCGEGRRAYDHYGYKPRSKNPTQDSPATPESQPAPGVEPTHAPQTDKKNNKR